MKSPFLGLVYGLAAIALLVALTAGCNPYLHAESPAPPGRSARLDEVTGFWGLKYYRMEISTGVAMALTCERGAPCEHVKIVSDNPAIADVRPASLGVLEKSFAGDAHTASAVVVVGKAAGTAHLRVTSEEGHREVVVTVVPAPPAPTPATVAAVPSSAP